MGMFFSSLTLCLIGRCYMQEVVDGGVIRILSSAVLKTDFYSFYTVLVFITSRKRVELEIATF